MAPDEYNEVITLVDNLQEAIHSFLTDYNSEKITWLTEPSHHSARYNSDACYPRESDRFKQVLKTLLRVGDLGNTRLRLFPRDTLVNALKSTYALKKHMDKMNGFLSTLRQKDKKPPEDSDQKSKLCSQFYPLYDQFLLSTEPFQRLYVENAIQSIQIGIKTKLETVTAVKPWGMAYQESSKNHRDLSIVWIFLSLALLLTFMLFTLNSIDTTLTSLNGAIDNVTNKKDLELFSIHKQVAIISISMKLVFSSMLFSILMVMFKNYKINEHHRILNRDRHLATKSITHLMDASGNDNSLKLTILEKVTDLLFDTKNSGYIKNLDSKSEPDTSSLVQLSKVLKLNDK